MNKRIKKNTTNSTFQNISSNSNLGTITDLSFKVKYLIIILLSFFLYANTIGGDYVLDDSISITSNKLVQEGFKGIKKILTNDSFYGFVNSSTNLQGGRYRPLALVSFAIEHEMLGDNPYISHLINLFIWCICCVLLFKLLHTHLVPESPDLAFIAAIIFVIHPIHTEVVANIKSRDELFSWLFLLCSIILLLKHITNKESIGALIFSLLFYLLALLSKENGIVYFAIYPLIVYFFKNINLMKTIKICLPYLFVVIGYLIIRFSIVGFNSNQSNHLFNNPFLYATKPERIATIMYCLLKYISILFIPYPLSYDYSFNQLPIVTFTNPLVVVSIIIYSTLILFAIKKLPSKNIISFCILFFLISLFIVSNLVIDIGALFAERLLFQPSLAFCIAVAYFIVFISKINPSNPYYSKVVPIALLLSLVIVFGYRTIARNNVWKSEYTLYLNDVKTSPNSAIANNAAGTALLKRATITVDEKQKRELLINSIPYFQKAVSIFKNYPEAYINLSNTYIIKGDLEEAEKPLLIAKKINTNHPQLKSTELFLAQEFNKVAKNEMANKNIPKANYLFEKATIYDTLNAAYWFDLGGTSFYISDFTKARKALIKCLAIKPDYKEAQIGLEELEKMGIKQ